MELLNGSGHVLNLCSFSFADSRDDISPICEGRINVSPNSYVVIARNGAVLSTFFPGRAIVTVPEWPALNNSGDSVRLYQNSVLIDEVTYLAGWGKRGYSIERVDPEGPSWAAFNWRSSKSPFKATPGEQNSVFEPDHTPPGIILAEKQRDARVFIVFDEPVDTASLSENQFRIRNMQPQSIEVLTDSSILMHFSVEPGGDFLVSRNVVDYSSNASAPQTTPLSFIPAPGDLVINEFLYEPLSDDFDALANQPEYVEILNVSEIFLSLRHLALVGPENEEGKADSLKTDVLYPVIAPNQFGIFYTNSPPNLLDRAFPSFLISAATSTMMPIRGTSLSLLNSGDLIRIIAQDSTIDEVQYEPSWHYPDLVSTRGISLERRSINSSPSSPSNWSSSVHPEGGTPGFKNSIYVPPLAQNLSDMVAIAPTPFTPNGDGMQDVLSIIIRPQVAPQSVRIRIFDSKGRQVRTLVPAALVGQESTFIWDGTSNSGMDLPTGMYVLFVELHGLLHNEVQKIKKIAVLAHPR